MRNWSVAYIDDDYEYGQVLKPTTLQRAALHTCIRRAMLKQASQPDLTYVVVNRITKEKIPVRRWSQREILQ